MARRLRPFVGGLAAALIVTSVAPSTATRADVPVRTEAVEIAGAVDGSRVFPLSMPASHVALHWPGAPDAQLSVAFSADGTTFGPEEPVEIDEVGAGRRDGRTYGALMVADGMSAIRVTSDRPLPKVDLLILDTRRDDAAAWQIGEAAAASTAQLAVVRRSAWGADESLRFDGSGKEIWPREYFPIQKLVVHHTAMGDNDPDPAATVRAIYYYHAVTQKWGDIGYNFLIDSAGRVYEGRYSRNYPAGVSPTGDDSRGRGVVAGHARGYNAGTVGVALLGTFDDRAPTTAARDSLVRTLAWASIRHGLNPRGSGNYVNPINGATLNTNTIAAHRDYNATACPGARLYSALPDIRNRVLNLMVAQTFSDIGSSPFIGDIAWLLDRGITNGCGGGKFCPAQIVKRDQMASFLARALKLPPPTRDHFWDDNGSTHEADINRVADAGITLGCSEDGRYCPGVAVTRDQMASFLARALKLPPPTRDHFWDDNGSTHEADINRVADARITLGCSQDGRYCPGAPTTREQMAAFLHRGLMR